MMQSGDSQQPMTQDHNSMLLLRKNAHHHERGMALILALVMLVLLTMLGTWVLDATTTDLKIAGNSKNLQTAFYYADAGLAFITAPETLNNLTSQLTGSNLTSTPTVMSMGSGSFRAFVVVECNGPVPRGPSSSLNTTIGDIVTGNSSTITGAPSLEKQMLAADATRYLVSDTDVGSNSGGYRALYLNILSDGSAQGNSIVSVEETITQLIPNSASADRCF